MHQWLSVVGIGEDGWEGVNGIGKALITEAKVVFGGKRHLDMLAPTTHQAKIPWSSPIATSLQEIAQLRGQKVCVLASGDPLCYGIGTTLLGYFPIEEMIIVPSASAFSLACAHLGWSLPDVETISLCGRPLSLLNAVIYPGAKVLVLSAQGETPAQVAEHLTKSGFGASQLTVLERMGGKQEQQIQGIAADWSEARVADLNLIAITCKQENPLTSYLPPRLPGLPDDAYKHDGQLTKWEVRAVTLAALAPLPGQLLWDIGAGCGSIAIEWLRSDRRCRAWAVEKNPHRISYLVDNALSLGTPHLQVKQGEALEVIPELPQPDAIFIGGGLTTPGLCEYCWAVLPPGGHLVANAVTVEGEQQLFKACQGWGGKLSRLAISRAESLGQFLGWKALAPVTQWLAIKPPA